MTYDGIKHMIGKIKRKTGINFSSHKLRHTFASLCVDQNLELPKLQRILGHSNIQSTMIYANVSTESLKEGLNAIELRTLKCETHNF